jgi:mono/diheme cytochrome c family protein
MSKLALLSYFLSLHLFAQVISFSNGKTFSLPQLKEKFKIHTVVVYNYDTRSFEKYHAFTFNEILDETYGEDKWQNNFSIKVGTKDKYTPIIEIYKFRQRKAYLAFARADQKQFTTITGYKDKFVKLAPYYLIWKEDYKKNAAKRRNHWPWRIRSFHLEKNAPAQLIPGKEQEEDVTWGYKNYIKQCIACHKINGIGGRKAQELISNKLINKLKDSYLRKFISNPRSINKDSKMPMFPKKIDIRAKRINDIIKYLRYMSTRDIIKNEKKQ